MNNVSAFLPYRDLWMALAFCVLAACLHPAALAALQTKSQVNLL